MRMPVGKLALFAYPVGGNLKTKPLEPFEARAERGLWLEMQTAHERKRYKDKVQQAGCVFSALDTCLVRSVIGGVRRTYCNTNVCKLCNTSMTPCVRRKITLPVGDSE